MVRKSGLPVRFSGAVSDDQLLARYRQADIAVAPATYGESFGVVLLEAMAAGLPVVASDLPGYREVLRSSEGGLLVPPEDPASLASALSRLITDPAARARLGKNGRRHVRRYDWENVVDQVEACYGEVVDRPGSKRSRVRALQV